MTMSQQAAGKGWHYNAGIGVAVLTSFLIVWTSIVRDDGHAAGSFMIILAAGVGAFAAWFRAEGMARTMAGVAAMQLLLGMLTATAPIVAQTPDGSLRAMLFNSVFAGFWLLSAMSFRIASKR